jgi:hypothetical protein
MATNGLRPRRRATSSGQPKLALGASVPVEILTGEKADALRPCALRCPGKIVVPIIHSLVNDGGPAPPFQNCGWRALK